MFTFRKLLSFFLCVCMFAQTIPSASISEGLAVFQEYQIEEQHIEEEQITEEQITQQYILEHMVYEDELYEVKIN